MNRSIVAGGLALLAVLLSGTLSPWREQMNSFAPGIAEAATSGSANAKAIEEIRAGAASP